MNRVEKVSIGGYAFTLEQKAYEEISTYLNGLNRYYRQREGGEEVVESLEERLAELIHERRGSQDVISVKTVREAIAILGKPEAFDEDTGDEAVNEGTDEKTEDNEWWKNDPDKKLYRCSSHKVLGGVASGLALYFKKDVVLIRLIWIAIAVAGLFLADHTDWGDWLVIGTVMTYIALWIAIPLPANIREIEEQEQMKSFVRGSETGSTVGKVIRLIIGILMVVTGGLFFLTNTAALVGLSFWETGDLLGRMAEDYEFILPVASSTLFWVELWFVMLLPFTILLYEGIRLLFDIKAPSWHPGLIMTVLWLIAVLAMAVTCAVIFLNLHTI